LVDIIEKIPNFIKTFIKSLQSGIVELVGKFYLGDIYDLAILENFPLCKFRYDN